MNEILAHEIPAQKSKLTHMRFCAVMFLVAVAVSALASAACTKPEKDQAAMEGEEPHPAVAQATDGGPPTDGRGGTLVFVVPRDPPSYDGHRETTFALIHPLAPHYSLLVKVDPKDRQNQRIVGDLAKSWDVSDGGKTYTFHLHQPVQFHDGSPLTSRDVVASYNKIIYPPKGVVSPRMAYYEMVASIAAPDPATVVFRLRYPTSAFLPAMATPFNFIYSADKLEADIRWYEHNVMGSGPFRLADQAPGAYWRGERFENYFRPGLPRMAGFEAIFAPKESVRIQAIRGRRAMIEFRGFSPQGRDDLVRAVGDRITVQESPWNCSNYLVPNTFRKPFDDVRVRRALTLALDRWGGSKYLSRIAVVKSVGGVVFPGHPLAMSDAELERLPGYGRDIEASRAEARNLLREAGVPEGFKFKLHNRAVDQPYKIIGTWVIDQWRQIGLDVEQWVQQGAPFFRTLETNPSEFDVSIDFNCQAVVNPTLDISKFISYDRSPANYGKYIDRELDRLYDAQLRETDPVKQKALIKLFETRLLGDQVLYITTLWWHRIIPHDSRVQGWLISPSHYLNQDLAEVWVKEE